MSNHLKPMKLDYDLVPIYIGDMVTMLHENFIGQIVMMDPSSDRIAILSLEGKGVREVIADDVAAIN